MKRSLRNSILLLLTAMLLTVSALADSGPKAQLTVKVVNAPSEPYYLDLLEKGDYQGHTYGSGDGDDTYSGLDWSYSEEEIAALDDELLDALRARNCKMAVASSTDSARVLHNLETAGVRGYFSAVIGGDQVTHSKPEPEIFLKAAAALDTPPGLCMVLEDSYNGVRAGAAAGCFTVMVPDMDPPTPEMERLAWAIVPGLTDVARLLEQTDLQKR
jgi:HAD superfamily hydrolase (TIGR01509 family)